MKGFCTSGAASTTPRLGPLDPVIEISGAVAEPFFVPLGAAGGVPRRQLSTGFHCVAG